MLRLPHPELAGVLEGIKRNKVDTRRAAVAGIVLRYAAFRRDPAAPDFGACYDADRAIYLPDSLVAFDERVADLIAYHEQVEVREACLRPRREGQTDPFEPRFLRR